MTALIESLNALASLLVRGALRFDEAKKRSYYYDIVNVKRSIPDANACELCEECADESWIDDDAVFESGEDAPPHHPNCKCQIEYGEKRKRVYV